MDGAGLIVDFDLSKAWHPKEEILVVDETLILRQTLVVVPHLPVHAVEERPLCELQVKESQDFGREEAGLIFTQNLKKTT